LTTGIATGVHVALWALGLLIGLALIVAPLAAAVELGRRAWDQRLAWATTRRWKAWRTARRHGPNRRRHSARGQAPDRR
jgi:hypothetical protein